MNNFSEIDQKEPLENCPLQWSDSEHPTGFHPRQQIVSHNSHLHRPRKHFERCKHRQHNPLLPQLHRFAYAAEYPTEDNDILHMTLEQRVMQTL